MININTKPAFVAVVALLLALTGCKKDDTYPSMNFETSSLDFEWNQTKEITLQTNKVVKIAVPTAPSGWTCTRKGNRVTITSPAQSSTATLSGTIVLTATGDEGAQLSASVKVAIKIAEEIAQTANSIIVSEPGKRFKFNALRRGEETAETITGATGATRVWTTSKTAIVNVSLENGYLYFATGADDDFTDANAVVAVTDKDGNALWSWHIWATDDDPTANPDLVGGARVMSRNLGAFVNSNASGADAADSYGLYYQWGRKDPFVGPAVWNSTSPRYLYGNNGGYITHAYVASAADTGTIAYATANPNTFIAGYESNGFDWLYSGSNASERWSTTSKTIYDPCPRGWRVAPADIWAGFTTAGSATSDPARFAVEGDYTYGWTFTVDNQAMFYPAAGRRSFSPYLAKPEDNFTNVVNDENGVGYPVGFYWSGKFPLSADTAMYPGRSSALIFGHDYINPAYSAGDVAEYAPSGGFPLRCIAQ